MRINSFWLTLSNFTWASAGGMMFAHNNFTASALCYSAGALAAIAYHMEAKP